MVKIAFAGFGEINTPIEVLKTKCEAAVSSIKREGVSVEAYYPIRDDYKEKDINAAIEFFNKKEFDVMIVCIAGWIPSHAVIKVIDNYRDKPIALWGLCGWLEEGRLVTTAD